MSSGLNILDEVICAGCHEPIQTAPADATLLLQYWYHHGCEPSCSICARTLVAVDDDACPYEAVVVSVSWGYAVNPTRYWCPSCWNAAPHDDPPALD